MNARTFDNFARNRAGNLSRRRLIRQGGAGAAALALLGLTSRSADGAQRSFSCSMDLELFVRDGPNDNEELVVGADPGELIGTLTIEVDDAGSFSSGEFEIDGGDVLSAAGQIDGYQIAFRIELNEDDVFIGVGVGENRIEECDGRLDGLLTGPEPGDLGDWHAVASSRTSGVIVAPKPTTGAVVTPKPTASSGNCPAGQVDCGGVCVDLKTDPNNCGACGAACGPDQPCGDGFCHCEYGPGTCLPGYVWREAAPGDLVCVSGEVRSQAAADNADAANRVDPNCYYGVDACLTGYVWRDAFANDHVCVTGDVRSQAAADNAAAASRVDPGGAYGPDSCVVGYVWREASPTDHVCVTGDVRSQAAADNAAAASRVDPNCIYGTDACLTGYVWRDAFAGDHVCVTGEVRSQAAVDNADAANRVDPYCVT